MNERGSPILLVVCVLVMAGVCGGLFYLRNGSRKESVEESKPVEVKVEPADQKEEASKEVEKVPKVIEKRVVEVTFDSSSEVIQNFEHGLSKVHSVEDLSRLLEKLGVTDLTKQQLQDLYQKVGKNGANLKRGNTIDEIGELERRKRSRWALNLEDGSRIFFDMKKDDEGNWKIEKIHDVQSEVNELDSILKKGSVAQLDGLMVAHSFVQFAMKQEFSKAKKLVDVKHMSDVQLAGLCIIFDEGGYRLRRPRGVLASYNKHIRAGYTIYITSDGMVVPQFSLVLSREKQMDPWKIVELNFNSLLEEFIRVNGGDSYFSPFVKNPQGGDSIVVYFDFNTNQLSNRTQRQLNIVANILKLDKGRKITLTGHTDAVGGVDYNKELSKRRALAVRDYLVSQGVAKDQIVTIGYGAHRPRKANTRADGSDNPEGRKANRRTEIYLDF